MTITLTETDTASGLGDGTVFCAGGSSVTSEVNNVATSGGTAGTTDSSSLTIPSSSTRVFAAFVSASGEPNSISWEAGNYVAKVEVTTAAAGSGNTTWDGVYICRLNSGLSNQATVGSVTRYGCRF